MLTFDDVRKTDKTTFFFFPNQAYDEFIHFLHAAGITEREAQALTYEQTKRRYPDMAIPTVPRFPHLGNSADVNPTFLCRRPCLLISRFDLSDLERKLREVHDSPEAKAWSEKRVDESLKEQERWLNEPETRNTELPKGLDWKD